MPDHEAAADGDEEDEWAELMCVARADQVVEVSGARSILLEAIGVATDGRGGLEWVEAPSCAAVAAKFRMMSAMLNDSPRNECYAAAIEEAVRDHIARTDEPPASWHAPWLIICFPKRGSR